MATRSHTEAYVLMRNNAYKRRNHSKYTGNDEERVTLVNEADIRTHDDDGYDDDFNPHPTWMAFVDDFRYEASKISNKIVQLGEVQDNLIRSKSVTIFDEKNHEPFEEEIELKSKEIFRLFNRLNNLVNELRNVSSSNSSLLLSNILQWEFREISELTNAFRGCQRSYVKQEQDREKFNDKFVIRLDDDELQSSAQEELIPYNIANGDMMIQDQKVMYALDTDFIKTRDKEMTVILKSVSEINQIFHDINSLVVNQGTLMDRIDFNIESVQSKVQQGVGELNKAEKSLRRSRKMKCIVIFSCALLLLLIIMIINS